MFYNYLEENEIEDVSINNDEIRHFLKSLDEKKYSKSTISRILSALRHYYNYLMIKNNLKNNPFKQIRNPKKDKKMPNFLQYNELEDIINSIPLDDPLHVRNRQEGDKIYIKGMLGSKKVKDIFINEKVSMEEREMWPIVVDSNGVIVWIPGLKKSKFDKQINENYDIILKYY